MQTQFKCAVNECRWAKYLSTSAQRTRPVIRDQEQSCVGSRTNDEESSNPGMVGEEGKLGGPVRAQVREPVPRVPKMRNPIATAKSSSQEVIPDARHA